MNHPLVSDENSDDDEAEQLRRSRRLKHATVQKQISANKRNTTSPNNSSDTNSYVGDASNQNSPNLPNGRINCSGLQNGTCNTSIDTNTQDDVFRTSTENLNHNNHVDDVGDGASRERSESEPPLPAEPLVVASSLDNDGGERCYDRYEYMPSSRGAETDYADLASSVDDFDVRYTMSDSDAKRVRGRGPRVKESVPFSVSSRSRFHSEAKKDRGVTPRRHTASTESLPVMCVAIDVADLLETDRFHHELQQPVQSGGSAGDADSKRSTGLWSMTRREKLALLCLALVDLSSQMCLSIMAPFFPDEALKKGVSSSISGWIFGVFALVQFVTSPFFGKIIPTIGSRFMIAAGQFFSGGCIILFGLLDYVESNEEDSTMFVILCFVLRICLALGCTASSTASFAVTANIFPDQVSTVFGVLETAVGVGMMVGPALGGVLFQVGGFITAFAVLGGVMILSVPVIMITLPKKDEEDDVGTQPVSLLQIMRIPSVIVVCLAVIMSATIWAIMDPTLAPHLAEFNLSPAILGLLFLFMSAFYAIFSPFWGWLADKMSDSSPMIAVGFVVTGVGLLLLGPSGIIGFSATDNYLWLNIIALGILGISVSLAIVPTFDNILDVIEKNGIEDSFGMYSYVAGIWGGCYALGEFIGPSLGGMLYDNCGFPKTMTYSAGACIVMAFIIFLNVAIARCRNPTTLPLYEPLDTASGCDSIEPVEERSPLLWSPPSPPVATASLA